MHVNTPAEKWIIAGCGLVPVQRSSLDTIRMKALILEPAGDR